MDPDAIHREADQQVAHDAETQAIRQRMFDALRSVEAHTAQAEVGLAVVDAYRAFAVAAPDPPAEPVEKSEEAGGGFAVDMLPHSIFTPSLADLAELQLRPPSHASTPDSTLGAVSHGGAASSSYGQLPAAVSS